METNRIEPQAGQESVWDYPTPPRVEETNKHIQVICNEVTIADTRQAKRVLQTGHPPVYYIPQQDIQRNYLVPRSNTSLSEFKGLARYYGLFVEGIQIPIAAWYYAQPELGYEAIQMYVAFYANHVDVCFVDGEKVIPQTGGFYGGWITSDIVGPFEGDESEAVDF